MPRRTALPRDVVTPSHLHAVLATYAMNRRPDDVERLFREFDDSPVRPNDACREVLLNALSFAGDHARAREWFDRFDPSPESEAFPRLLAALISAHDRPEAHDALLRVRESIEEGHRRHPDVAIALVFACAGVGDPERAEEHLAPALDVVADADTREAMVETCLRAYVQRVRPAVKRIVALAERAGIDVRYPALLPGNPFR